MHHQVHQNLPDNIDKKLIDLHGEQARTDPIDGSSIDRGVKDLIHDHSTQVDLNFPDLEMYRRSYHDRAKWNEPSIDEIDERTIVLKFSESFRREGEGENKVIF